MPAADRALGALVVIALLSPAVAHAEEADAPAGLLERLERAVVPRAGTGHLPPVDPDASCEQVYDAINRTLPYTYRTRPGFTDDPLNGVIGAVGTVFPPAFLLWGLRAADGYRADLGVEAAKARVRELRHLSARKGCWVD